MSGSDKRDSDAPPSAEEVAASQKLREALEKGHDPIANALKAAWAPEPITAEAHDRILDDVPTEEELRLAAHVEDDPIFATLKAAWNPGEISAETHQAILDDMPTADELRLAAMVDEDEMVLALKAAWNPGALDAKEHERIVDRALAGAVVRQLQPRSRLRVAAVTVSTVFALAAGMVLFLQTQSTSVRGGRVQEVALAKARSTQPLFDEPFHAGETSARIDKIALARASDYRDNYFAKRGVK